MRIAGRPIGPQHPPFIIGEVGVNHDGDIARAIQLIDIVHNAGADAVKLQHFRADLLMSQAIRPARYQADAGEHDAIAMLERLQLSIDDLQRIVEHAHHRNLAAIVTVFSEPLVNDVENLGIDAYKSASPDLVNRPLLDAMAATDRPLIVSTGASHLDEVVRAHRWLEAHSDRIAFLQCTSAYPTASADAELAGITTLSDALDVPIGYSDHTTEVDTGAIAVSLGATILEKHVTHDRSARGPDHSASLDAAGFARYVQLVRDRQATLAPDKRDPRIGTGVKRVLDCERDVRHVSRQSLTLARKLPAMHTVKRHDLTIKRPADGIEPFHLDEVIGRRTRRALDADVPLTWDDLA